MTHTAKARWKIYGVLLPLLILLSPILVVCFGLLFIAQTWPEIVAEEFRWAGYCDDYKAKHDGVESPIA